MRPLVHIREREREDLAGCCSVNRPIDYKALREGACDATPFEVSCCPFSIQHWHFVTKMARKTFLLASASGKTAGSSRQRKFSFRPCERSPHRSIGGRRGLRSKRDGVGGSTGNPGTGAPADRSARMLVSGDKDSSPFDPAGRLAQRSPGL